MLIWDTHNWTPGVYGNINFEKSVRSNQRNSKLAIQWFFVTIKIEGKISGVYLRQVYLRASLERPLVGEGLRKMK